MKVKTGLLLVFTACILGAAICFPAVLFERQESRLLGKIHTEKMDQPSSIQIPVLKVEEKLSMISSANLADSNTIMLKTSGREDLSAKKEAVLVAQKSLSELSQKGMIPETDISGYVIDELSHSIYSNTDSQISVDCYSFFAKGENCDVYVMMDVDTGKIYSLSIMASRQEAGEPKWSSLEFPVQIWADYLGIVLMPVKDLSEYDSQMYTVKGSDACYLFSTAKDTLDIHIRLVNGLAFGYVDAAIDDADMMGNSTYYDTIGR